ncbi:MAG: hypothetical protein JO061_15370 [Acidobacteriaceae bacterium]|nr:hypothetical protein [Acidobacteriaceae bacterium]
MLVRIRFQHRRRTSLLPFENIALAGAALLTPSALLAFTVTFWIIASDLRWTGEFFLSHGLFSHWQVWLSSAAVLLLLARLLDRVGRDHNGFSRND